jgi:hypothetical protein
MVAGSWAIMHGKGASPMTQKIHVCGINMARYGSNHLETFNTAECEALERRAL